ncbi:MULTISPECIES: hypothetical protein [unclassified Methylobacterium]|uniref:hypothetical protein n=1 Tax=unclassified Methylobacterium TaxID=2615210 RepID=UPI0008E6B6FE|nr:MULTISPECIES: hypothetical protein [unclassified Methylobacterium]SFU50336.1 hypothetical protein SAMN02799643_00948 [Methylobacterium sp. UNCCL125]
MGPYNHLLDGDVCRRIPGLPRHEPLALVSLPADLAAAPPAPGEVVSGIQFDSAGTPTAYVIPPDMTPFADEMAAAMAPLFQRPPARTRDADLPAVWSAG